MTSKYTMYADLADRQTRQVTQSMGDWTGFLNTAGRLYKYPFEEQLMIHAQRPDAIACAPLEFWNRPMNRFVKAGSKGIALLDNSGGKGRLKYVFDVADTQDGRYSARRPFLWEMKQEHEAPVVEALKYSYDIDTPADSNNDYSLGDYLHTIAQSLSARYYENNQRDIAYAVEDSFLHGLDEFNVGVAFRDALTVSTAYALMTRCGVDPSDYIGNEDFQAVFDFNSPESVYALGKAVSDVSEEVLREIEVTIKKYERQKAVEMEGQRHERSNNQRDNVQPERGLSDARHHDTLAEPVAGQVRDDAEGLSERTQGDSVHDIQHEGDSVPPLSGSREPSEHPAGFDDGGVIGEVSAAEQGSRPDGLDGSHEQPQSTSGGSNTQRTNLQLEQDEQAPQNEPPSEQTQTADEGGFNSSETFSQVGKSPDEQGYHETVYPLENGEASVFDGTFRNEPLEQLSLSFFPTEQEQIEIIQGTRQAEPSVMPPPVISITQEDIDQAILDWNGDVNSKIRVYEYMQEHARARETANFLKQEYGGESGIFTVEKAGAESITMPWAKVQRRIGQLMDDDRFFSADERVAVDNTPVEQDVAEAQAQESAPTHEPLGSPPPVLVVNWNTAQHDFDLNLYKDRDVVAYDLDGVEHRLGRSGSLTYISSTGMLWGGNSVSGNIYEQITAYRNGELSDEDVRANYLSVLDAYKNRSEAEPVHVPDQPAETAIPIPQGSPHWKDYQTIAAEHRDKILFYRLGDFYEVMGSDANAVARFLNLTVTGRDVGLAERVPIVGVPEHSLDSYVAKLVDEGFGVAIRHGADSITVFDPKPQLGSLKDSPQQDNYDGYILSYRFLSDPERIVVFNDADSDSDEINIVARYYADGSLFVVDEGMPQSVKDYIREYCSVNFAGMKQSAEERLEQMIDFAMEQAEQAKPAMPEAEQDVFYTPENRIAYRVGDIFGQRSTKCTIEKVDDDLIHYNFIELPMDAPATMLRSRFDELLDNGTNTIQTLDPGVPIPAQSTSEPQIDEGTNISPPLVVQSRTNFRITDDNLGEGGAKTKYAMNVAAIRTLQAIEAENRLATPEEQETLSRYVGWGGIQQAFDADVGKTGWGKEYEEIKGLLTPEEYDSARASTLNAHYTSPTVIKAMYETLDKLGFKEGNLLEPSMGVGNFFGLLPEAMQNAKLYGVELDSVTGRIARQLYQDASIKVMGFEETDTPDAFFDAAIGNVPFGGYKVVDGRYDKHNFNIHDYFFAKTLDQVRPGGIVAFVTSKGTLDKNNPQVRKYIAQRAELLGAVRLPNNAFLKNAGTEVTSDIIFLQRREALRDIEPDWVHLGQTDDGIPINSYFVDNPHMMLGKMSVESGGRMYGAENAATCVPIEGADLSTQLRDALSHIEGQITEVSLDDLADEAAVRYSIPADPLVKNFSYALVTTTNDVDSVTGELHARKIGEGDLYFRENSRMFLVEMPAATMERVRGMVELRDSVRELMDMQLYDYPDHAIAAQQAELNTIYDRFTAKHGLINSTANARAFQADSSYYLLASLEILDEDKQLERKSDMFTKRTIAQQRAVTSVDTSSEALAVSISTKAKVDIDYMAQLSGFTPEKIMRDLEGVIFCDIGNPNRNVPAFDPDTMKIYEKYPLVTADEYLSGNVREKLHRAMSFQELIGDSFHGVNVVGNIRALEQAQPKDLDASEISVRCGSTWVDKQYYEQFMYEVLQTPRYLEDEIRLNYAEATGEWNITGKTRVRYDDVTANTTFGTERANAYKILEDTLNLRDVRIYDTKFEDGKEIRVLNRKETTLAAQKQDAVKQAFKDWVFQDPDRRRDLVQTYNERFNSIRTREYDGTHIQFSGMSPEITLKSHQTDAIARVLYGGNTLLAHEVGAGKSFQMIGAAMESKRLGLCNKSLIAVPGHLTEQMAGEFLRLYPSANILVATRKDFEPRNRKKFCAKIATGDYDAVIIGHSQLEKIPLSKERQERLLTEQIEDITDAIEAMKRGRAERFTVKQMEKTRKSLEVRLERLNDDKRKDDVVMFEQLGVDRLFVDESHSFKNLFMYTKMRNVAGLSQTEAQKSSDMFLKCRYMDEKTGGKGVIFATGTPITNSMAELYTVQRYLQYDTLQRIGMTHFDSWASTFGETTTSIELSPEGIVY